MIKNIQLLRLFSCLCILLFHFGPHYAAMGGSHFMVEVYKNLYFGTDIFRVISGFILMHITFTKEHTKNYSIYFLTKRFIRIFVSYYPIMLLTIITFYIFLPDYLGKIDWVGSIFLTNIRIEKLVIPVTWSLTYELYFYILFSIGLFFNIMHSNKLSYILLFTALVIVIMPFILLNKATYFLFSPYLIEFIIGMLIYKNLEKLLKIPIYQLVLILILFLIPSIYFTFNEWLRRAVGFGVSSGVILVIFLSLEKRKIWLAPKFIASLGSTSYIVFLSHHMLINLFLFLGIRGYVSNLSPILIEISSILFIIFVLIISFLYYKIIDVRLYSTFLKNIFYRIKGYETRT